MKIIILVLIFYANILYTQDCGKCTLEESFGVRDSLINLTLENNLILYNITHVERTTLGNMINIDQALKVTMQKDTSCVDTIIPLADVKEFWSYGIGKQPTFSYNVLPVKEYIKTTEAVIPKPFLEFNLAGYYAGADESEEGRQVGFDNFMYGIEANYYLANDFLTKNAALLVSASAILERSRLRIPLGLQFRWEIAGSPEIKDTMNYHPSNCLFQNNLMEQHAGVELDDSYIEDKNTGEKDSASVLLREKSIIKSKWIPYLFGELGSILDTGFEGNGSSPSLNSEDFFPYYLGIGAGLHYENFNLSLGYRLTQLHLRTPCENCTDKYVLNTNLSHSLSIKFGYYFNL